MTYIQVTSCSCIVNVHFENKWFKVEYFQLPAPTEYPKTQKMGIQIVCFY